MYEEDRQTALEMYEKMIDNADDEQAMLQFLVSPTRQAVVLARTYDAKERKLQVHSQYKDEEDLFETGETPAFVSAIAQIEQDARESGIALPQVDEGQFSLFDDGGEQPVSGGNTAPALDDYTAPIPISTDSFSFDSSAFAGFVPDSAPAAPLFESTTPEATPEFQAVDLGSAYGDMPVEAESAESGELPSSDYAEVPSPESAAPSAQDDVDAFLSDFSIVNDELSVPVKETDDAALTFAPESAPAAAEDSESLFASPHSGDVLTDDVGTGKPTRKPRVALLILFIILAIPVTAIGIAVLLIPTLIFLALAVAVLSVSGFSFSAAFGGFAVLADVLMVLGLALVLLAIGIFFLWMFIWFIGGAIAGLIRSVIHLGGKWCYKEVAKQ